MQKSRIHFTHRVGYLVALGMGAKFFVDTANQVFNPYLIIFAAGAGVSTITMGHLVSLRNLSGLISPLIGSLADHIGYRRVMRLSLALSGIGVLFFAYGLGLPVLVIGMVLWGIGQGSFTPVVHSYLSSLLPYHRRARYLGILEYSWALAGILGLFSIGFLIESFGWRLPLYLLGGGLIAASLLMGTLPKTGHAPHQESEETEPENKGAEPKLQANEATGRGKKKWYLALRDFFYLGAHQSSAWAAVLVNVFNFFAIFHIMIVHGAYLEAEYAFTPTKLGLVALLMGLFDWGGSILVSIAGDRIGKRRSVMIGISGMLLFFALMPVLTLNVYMALAGLIIPRFFFEFATVSNFPLLSEQYPAKRGKVLSFGVAGGLVGTTIAASTGPVSYYSAGVWGLGPVSAAAVLISLFLILKLVKDAPHRSK